MTAVRSLVDVDIEHIIFGWVRRVEQSLRSDAFIPDMILVIFAKYYYDPECFIVYPPAIDKHFECTTNRLLVTKLTPCESWPPSSHYCNVYGKQIIETENNRNTYKWDLVIINAATYPSALIGISSSMGSNFQGRRFKSEPTPNYYCFGDGAKFSTGDIITIQLNLKERTFGFYKNDKYYFISSQVKVGQNIKYRLAISMCSRNQSICINSFHTVFV